MSILDENGRGFASVFCFLTSTLIGLASTKNSGTVS